MGKSHHLPALLCVASKRNETVNSGEERVDSRKDIPEDEKGMRGERDETKEPIKVITHSSEI
jgi:hypothetical protein